MSKKISMFFHKAHGVYVPGDIAGFAPDMAKKLEPVAEKYDPKKHNKNKPNAEDVDAEMTARSSELDAREAALVAREAALDVAPATAEKVPSKKAVVPGAPPVRGNT